MWRPWATQRPPQQGYYPCMFSCAPFYYHRVWWSGERWEIGGRPLDTTDFVAFFA